MMQVDQIYKNKPQNGNFTEMQVTIYIKPLKKKYPLPKNWRTPNNRNQEPDKPKYLFLEITLMRARKECG